MSDDTPIQVLDARFPTEHNVMPKMGSELAIPNGPLSGAINDPFPTPGNTQADKYPDFGPQNDNGYAEVRAIITVKNHNDEQYEERTGMIYWRDLDLESDSSSSSSSSSSSGDSKSTCIVPASWQTEGYTALFVAEMPEVRFDDVMRFDVKGPNSVVNIDPRFFEVCSEKSIEVVGLVPNKPCQIGARIEGPYILVDMIAEKLPTEVVIRLSGIRKGFEETRFPSRNEIQFHACNASINSAYPGAGQG